ncbi:MAG: hypothetical protein R3B40_09145 [Polyangiales bacterium]|nr:hypothetical protein [Sandaracinaceae bacterium]
MVDHAATLNALLPAVDAWFETEHRATALLCDRATKNEGKALAAPLMLPMEERPVDTEWLVTGMYVPLMVPLAARDQVREVLRKRTVHRVALHSHPVLAQLVYAYADELVYYPEQIHRRLTFIRSDEGLRLAQSAETCGGCYGTGIPNGHEPKGGPYPTDGPTCTACDGEGFLHHYGLVIREVSPPQAIVRLVPPSEWPTVAFYESDR